MHLYWGAHPSHSMPQHSTAQTCAQNPVLLPETLHTSTSFGHLNSHIWQAMALRQHPQPIFCCCCTDRAEPELPVTFLRSHNISVRSRLINPRSAPPLSGMSFAYVDPALDIDVSTYMETTGMVEMGISQVSNTRYYLAKTSDCSGRHLVDSFPLVAAL